MGASGAAVLVSFALLWSARVWALPTVSGTVSDTEGWSVAGAEVTFVHEGTLALAAIAHTDADGTYRVESPTVVEGEPPSQLPTAFHLYPNFPNPFNPSTSIPYQLDVPAHVRLRVYGVLGQRIRSLVDGARPAGLHTVQWDGRDDRGIEVAAGVYIVRMETEGFATTRRMLRVDGASGAGHPGHGWPSGRATAGAAEPLDRYTVTITGDDIVPVFRRGVVIRTDTTLAFKVAHLDASTATRLWLSRLRQGEMELRIGRFAKAAEIFLLAAQEAPAQEQARGWYFRGVALHRLGRFDDAIEAYEKTLELAPEQLPARWNLRVAWQQAGRDPGDLGEGQRLDLAPGLSASHPSVRFTEVGARAGVALVNMGRGSAWRDADGDGWLDLFTVADRVIPALFRNRGDGTFEDMAVQAGLTDPRGGWSTLWADYDNDGLGDLFITRDAFNGYGTNALYHAEEGGADGIFVDVTERAGIGSSTDAFGAAWGDYDNDGWLDLYIGNGIAQKGSPNALYRNRRDGTFADATKEAGVGGRGATIGVVWGDSDNDGDLDLYSVNYGSDNALYRNRGDGTFADVTRAAGVARPWWGFVAFFFDYDNDGWLDLYVSHWSAAMSDVIRSMVSGEPSPTPDDRGFLYRNNRDGTFTGTAPQAGLGRTFGTMAATHGDVDNDGFQDIYLANGGPAMDRFEPDRLFLNNGDGTFADVTDLVGVGTVTKGHGSTMADYDNDGDLDIYSPQGGAGPNPGDAQPNLLFRNEGNGNHWLIVHLTGRARPGERLAEASPPVSNRDGIGARVRVTVGTQLRYSEVNGGSGFGSMNSLPLEFGLATATQADTVEVRWPSGRVDRVTGVPADRVLHIEESGRTVVYGQEP